MHVTDLGTVKRAGVILLQSAPDSLEVDDVTHDIEQVRDAFLFFSLPQGHVLIDVIDFWCPRRP